MYLLNPGMADAALLLVLVRPVEMLDVGVLSIRSIEEEMYLLNPGMAKCTP